MSEAVTTQAARFSGWRVLALQVVGERMIEVAPDLAALKSTRLPLRLVVRIEGARLRPDAAVLAQHIGELRERWAAAGLRVDGIEIDHDCASAALAEYAGWLQELRAALPGAGTLSITALPTWLESPALAELLSAADASVLQVHAVDQPQRGLFDPQRAQDWIHAWAARTSRPFQVALPAYGVRVGVDAAGSVRAVDAEGAVDSVGRGGSELRADPRAVAGLLARLARAPPTNLAGFVWFRLPVGGDERSWNATTLAHVISGARLSSRFQTQVRDAGKAKDVWITNTGNIEAVPPTFRIPDTCRMSDALAGYHLTILDDGLQLEPDRDTLLRPGESIRAGWYQCASMVRSRADRNPHSDP